MKMFEKKKNTIYWIFLLQLFNTSLFAASCATGDSTCSSDNYINSSPCPLQQESPFTPTSPLNCNEISCVTTAIKNDPKYAAISADAIFVQVLLKEPNKAFVQGWTQGAALNRKADALLYRNSNNQTYRAIVSLAEPNQPANCVVESFEKLDFVGCPGMNWLNPPVDNDWFTTDEVVQLVLNDAKLMKKLAKRGVTKEMLINGDITPNGFYSFESFRKFKGERPCKDLIDKNAPNFRYYPFVFSAYNVNQGQVCVSTNWAMVEGLYFIVDVNNKTIYKIIDEYVAPKDQLPVPAAVDDPYPLVSHPPMQPLCISMPNGPSFTVQNRIVKWDNWEFEFAWQRSGITFYHVSYTENGVKRPILYKAANTESMVTYNAAIPIPSRDYISGDSFDYPILQRMAPLVKGRDIPHYANTYDITISDCCGNPYIIKDAIGIYEQETDLLWRVNDGVVAGGWPKGCQQDSVSGARKRQLVVRSIFSGFYYLWIYSYIFNQDGSMEVYADLGGQTTNDWVKPGEGNPWGELVAQQFNALTHTHSLVYRLDFEIGGPNNSVVEQNVYPVKNENRNKCGDVVKVVETIFEREHDAIRNLNPQTNRVWSVINENSLNRLGHPRGYELIPVSPLGNGTSEALDDSIAHKHYGILKHHLHVTPYRENEEYGVGEFPVLADRPTGIDAYVKNNDKIRDRDIVFWYTMNWCHAPHTEDYPFISILRQGFKLEPHNFFGMNPSCSINGIATDSCTTTGPVTATPCCSD